MIQYFDTEQKRKVVKANYNYLQNPTMHPERTLDDHVIFYIVNGDWWLGQEDQELRAEQGDIVILSAGHRHYGVRECAPQTKTMFMYFTALPGDFISPDSVDTNRSEHHLAIPTIVKASSAVSVLNFFEDIIKTYYCDNPKRDVKLSGLADVFLYELACVGTPEAKNIYPSINAVLSYIHNNPQTMFSIPELAAYISMESRTLTRQFKKFTGKTIHQYQLNLKLDMAYMQIKDNPNIPFKEIADNFGFYDEFHFSKLFKARFGYPPKLVKKI